MNTSRNSLMRWVPALLGLSLLAGAITVSVLGAKAVAANASAPGTANPQGALITALGAPGPHSSIETSANAWRRLVGSWDVEYTDYRKDGTVTRRFGRFTLAWVLDGRALQDFWVVDSSAAQKEREVYTEVFYFEPKTGTWAEVSIDPQEGSIATFRGGASQDDRIVLESKDLVPTQLRRWSFGDVRSSSFVFRDEASKDDGATWTLKAEYRMTRRGAAPAPQGSSD